MNGKPYYTYILLCENGALYSGITTDPARRLSEHAGKTPGGAKYTHTNKPDKFTALFRSADRASASRLEYALKKLSHTQKAEISEKPSLLFEKYCSNLNSNDYADVFRDYFV